MRILTQMLVEYLGLNYTTKLECFWWLKKYFLSKHFNCMMVKNAQGGISRSPWRSWAGLWFPVQLGGGCAFETMSLLTLGNYLCKSQESVSETGWAEQSGKLPHDLTVPKQLHATHSVLAKRHRANLLEVIPPGGVRSCSQVSFLSLGFSSITGNTAGH
jgi:hypothetical protein